MTKKREQPPKKNAEIIDRLQEFLDESGKNQEWLAEQLDITATAVSNWFKKGTIALENLLKIALKYNLSLDWLLTGRGGMYVIPGSDVGMDGIKESLAPYAAEIIHLMDELSPASRYRVLALAHDEVGKDAEKQKAGRK